MNGLLCPPDNASALAAALERLLREPELRAHLGQAGRTTVLRSHTWDQVARRILSLAAAARGELERVSMASPPQPTGGTPGALEVES